MAINPKSLANLKNFKKGPDPRRKGNGRPRKLPDLDKLLIEVLNNPDKKGITVAQQVLSALISKAKKGDVKAANTLLERAYGKVPQKINMEEMPKVRIIEMPKKNED